MIHRLRFIVPVMLAASSAAQAQQRQNIIFILADDHAAHAVSAYQKYLPDAIPLPATRNIDRIAREGMLFTNAFVTNSICTPARAAVLTGEYGHLTGVMTNFDTLHPMITTFPKLLRGAGYQTAIIGKWHLKDLPVGSFDHYELLPGQGSYYNPVLMSEKDTTRYTGYAQTVFTDHALQWIDRRDRSKPFFLMLTYNAPHRPWQAGPNQLPLYRDTTLPEPPTLWDDGSGRAFRTQDQLMTIAQDLVDPDLKLVDPTGLTPAQLAEWKKWYDPENAAFHAAGLSGTALTKWKYQRFVKDYMRAIQGVDEAVGRVLDELKRSGLDKNTIVVYSSDQGFFVGDKGWFDKRWMYEESLRTPLLVKWPGVVKPGSVNRDMVMNLDFAPTFLQVANVAVPHTMQGASMVPLLKGHKPANWRSSIYYQYFGYPDWHMVRRQYGVRDERYKLIRYYEVDKWELFDLKKDPHELKSVYDDAAYAGVKARMEKKLAELRAQYKAPEHDPVAYKPWELPAEYKRK